MKIKDLIDKVREIANENPDTTYDGYELEGVSLGCSYSNGKCSNDTVGCIIGQAILALDPDHDFDGHDQDNIYNLLFNNNALDMQINPSNEVDWLTSVQDKQDDGETWGNAVENTDSRKG